MLPRQNNDSTNTSVQKCSRLYTFNFIFKGIRTIVLNTSVPYTEVLLDLILNRIRCVHRCASLLFKGSEVIINTLHLRSEFFLRWLLVVQVTTTWYQCSEESHHCPRLFRALVVTLPELLVLVWTVYDITIAFSYLLLLTFFFFRSLSLTCNSKRIDQECLGPSSLLVQNSFKIWVCVFKCVIVFEMCFPSHDLAARYRPQKNTHHITERDS